MLSMRKSGRKPRLTVDELAELRHRYETTPISLQALADTCELSKPALRRWAANQGWVKFRPEDAPPPKPADQAAAEALDRHAAAGATAAHDGALARGLKNIVARVRKQARAATNKPRQPNRTAPPPAPEVTNDQVAPPEAAPPADQPNPPPSADAPAKVAKPGPGQNVIQFPGGRGPPPPKMPAELFPVRDKSEQAKIKVRLGHLRGVMSVQQLDQLQQHEELLANYSHLLRVYMAPHEFIALDGLDEEQAKDKLMRTQRAALSQLLPTERDTLAGALKVLTHSLGVTVQLKRQVAGLALKGTARISGGGEDDDQALPGTGDARSLPLKMLRTVREAMEVLTGARQRDNEPPKPPAPESIDDLIVERPPEEEEEPPR